MRALLLVTTALVLGACSSDDVYLPALLADPMAEYSHPALEVQVRSEVSQGTNLIGGAPRGASVLTGYVLEGSEEAVIEDILVTAEAAGWVFGPMAEEDGFRSWSATKELPEGTAELSINSRPRSSTREYDIAIRIEFAELPT